MTPRTLIICFIAFLFCSCNHSAQTNSADKTFDYKDNYLTVKRTIVKIATDKYKVTLLIKSPDQLQGYVTVEDKFENPIITVDSIKWKYAPYFSSDKEIRFVFSDPAKTVGTATPIPNQDSFEVDYIIKSIDKLKINGTVMYLVENRPVPLLITSADF